jgi:hypothetical protein
VPKTRDRQHEYSGDEEVIQRNIDRQREVIEARERSEDSGQAHRPPPGDPQGAGESALPQQWDIPAGGTSGPNTRGGSSKRQKPN